MLTETLASAILTASITGAGLILAIYALIAPISRKIFQEKVALMRKKKKEFDKLKIKIDSESSTKDFKRLKKLASEIKSVKMFPKYLGLGVLIVFVLFAFTIVCTFNWFINEGLAIWELTTLILFPLSITGFVMVGILAIVDVHWAMKKEFEQLKKEKEEVEKERERLEKTRAMHARYTKKT